MSLSACRVGEVVIGADLVGNLIDLGREWAYVVARSAGCADNSGKAITGQGTLSL